jgi:small subunit ribosomal protein S14
VTKKSLIVKEHQKKILCQKYADQRNKLRHILNDAKVSSQDKLKAQFEMQKLPIKSSPTRAHNRCQITGRPKAFLRRFGLSRLEFREQALKGYIPGIKKASW